MLSTEFVKARISAAVACYGVLDGDLSLKIDLTKEKGNANFTDAQADSFVEQYKLLNQLPNVPFNGFSATVFEDKTTGKHIIAMRGTEIPGQIALDLLKEDMRRMSKP